MPYYHRDCGGEIEWHPPFPIPPKCKKCGHRWSPLALYGLPPKNMIFALSTKKKVEKKEEEKYAAWAERIPFVTFVAQRLPRWPRWARILTVSFITVGIASVIYWFLVR